MRRLLFGAAIIALLHPLAPAAPQEGIVAVVLQDPLDAGSNSYLDLDTGKTFTFAQTPRGYPQFRDWLAESGVDVMCETRAPVEGLVAYDLAFVETGGELDRPRDYPTVRKALESIERQPFTFITFGASLPKVYLFSTRDGATGVLEISSTQDRHNALQLRFKLIPRPKPVELPPQRARRAANMAALLAVQIEQQQKSLETLREKYGERHPKIVQAEAALRTLREMASKEAERRNQKLHPVPTTSPATQQ